MKTRKLWIASYGGHYDAVVMFSKKPRYSKEQSEYTDGEKHIEVFDNKEFVVASMYMVDVETWFPDLDLKDISNEQGRPLAIELTKCMQIEITAPFDKWGRMESLGTNADY